MNRKCLDSSSLPQVAARMTKDSGVFGIPIPDDATRDPNSEFSPDRFLTSIATIQEVTAFYKDYMSSDGWIFDQEFSALEPSAAEDRKLGYITNAVYTKPTLPVTTVSIIIGNADGKPGHKRDLALYIIELPDEDLPRSVDDFLTGADRRSYVCQAACCRCLGQTSDGPLG